MFKIAHLKKLFLRPGGHLPVTSVTKLQVGTGLNMARPRIFDDHALTPAERMRGYRARKKQVSAKHANMTEALASMTKRQQANYVRLSPRSWRYIGVFIRDSEIEWDDDVVNGKYGKIGIAFLAEICKYGTRESQQLIHDRIKTAGAKAGRALWRQFLKENHPAA